MGLRGDLGVTVGDKVIDQIARVFAEDVPEGETPPPVNPMVNQAKWGLRTVLTPWTAFRQPRATWEGITQGTEPPKVDNRFINIIDPDTGESTLTKEEAKKPAEIGPEEEDPQTAPQTPPATDGGGGSSIPFDYGYDTSLREALDKAFPTYDITPFKRGEVDAEVIDDGMAYGGFLGQHYAGGGIASLGGYSDGGRLLRGPGDGVSDDIPAGIYRNDGSRQEARLADGEFVFPARIVSEIGNGSTEAGAKKLYAIMDRIQRDRSRTLKNVAKDTNAERHFASMMA